MKSEERHHLQENDLVTGLDRLNLWIRPYLAYIVLGLVVVVAGVLWMGYARQVADDENRMAWREFFAASEVGQFEVLIERYPHSPTIAYARLRIADLRFNEGKAMLLKDRPTAMSRLEEAGRLYEGLARAKDVPADVQMQAALGLAITTESRGALSEAVTDYLKLADSFPDTAEAMVAKRYAEELGTDQAKTFYRELASYQPKTPDLSLPEKSGIDAVIPPPPPPTTTPLNGGVKKDSAVNKSEGGITFETIDAPEPPTSPAPDKSAPGKSKIADKPASTIESKPASKEPASKEEASSAAGPKAKTESATPPTKETTSKNKSP